MGVRHLLLDMLTTYRYLTDSNVVTSTLSATYAQNDLFRQLFLLAFVLKKGMWFGMKVFMDVVQSSEFHHHFTTLLFTLTRYLMPIEIISRRLLGKKCNLYPPKLRMSS